MDRHFLPLRRNGNHGDLWLLCTEKDNLVKSAACICVLDTLVAFLAAFAIIPVVFVTLGPKALVWAEALLLWPCLRYFDGLPGGRIFGLFFSCSCFGGAHQRNQYSGKLCCLHYGGMEGFRLKATVILSVPMAFLSAGYSLSQLESRNINLPWFDFSKGIQIADECGDGEVH